MRPVNLRCVIVALLLSTVWVSASARGEIAESGVLVVYNSASADAVALA
jgi:P pilus assembly chaperone PapD